MARDTVFVLGAGASQEVGLPIGRDLARKIGDILNIQFNRTGLQSAGDDLIVDALRRRAQGQGPPFRDLQHAARRISDGIPLAPSIDGFLDNHSADEPLVTCGKLGIVRAILDAERRSGLCIDPSGRQVGLDVSKLADTWFPRFWRIFVEGCRFSDLAVRSQSIAFIVFNYDRCIEHFLYHAMQIYFGVKPNAAEDLVRGIAFYHPYGSVGALPWKDRAPAVSFGGEIDASDLLDLAANIETFTEGTDPSKSTIDAIRTEVESANRMVFLGSAFHPQNLKLLWPNGPGEVDARRSIFATAYKVSSDDVEVITLDVEARSGIPKHKIRVRNDLSCSALFDSFARSLSLL